MPGLTADESRSKRQTILEAARHLFVRQGYERTTIAEIADEAKMAVGTVYLYFRNKHEVYTSVSNSWVAEVAAVFQDPLLLSLPVEQAPRLLIEEIFRRCRDNVEAMALFRVELHSLEELQQHRQVEELVTQAIDVFLQNAVTQGQLAPFDTAMYARILKTLVDGVVSDCFVVERGEREQLYRECTIEMIERLFFGPSVRAGRAQQ